MNTVEFCRNLKFTASHGPTVTVESAAITIAADKLSEAMGLMQEMAAVITVLHMMEEEAAEPLHADQDLHDSIGRRVRAIALRLTAFQIIGDEPGRRMPDPVVREVRPPLTREGALELARRFYGAAIPKSAKPEGFKELMTGMVPSEWVLLAIIEASK